MKKILAIITALTVSTTLLYAQSKQETKHYRTSLSKGDLKNLNKFLSKYPSSVYTKEITYKRDSIIFYSLPADDVFAFAKFIKDYPYSGFAQKADDMVKKLSTTSLSAEHARNIVKNFFNLPDNITEVHGLLYAKGFKENKKEHIVAVISPQEDKSRYTAVILQHNGKGELNNKSTWSVSHINKEQIYTGYEKPGRFRLSPAGTNPIKDVNIGNEKYFQFNYTNEGKGKDIEFVTNLLSNKDGSIYSAMFSGKKENEAGTDIIEGNCMDISQGGAYSTPQMSYLIKYIGEKPSFKPVSKEKALTDEAIEWWYNENKKGTGTLAFGILPFDHPIVKAYMTAKDKEKGSKWDIAFFDIRENTVVVAYDKTKNQYSLIWCEPAPKNTKTDKFLNTVYFENDSLIALFYYKGNTTSKKRINLISKSIR